MTELNGVTGSWQSGTVAFGPVEGKKGECLRVSVDLEHALVVEKLCAVEDQREGLRTRILRAWIDGREIPVVDFPVENLRVAVHGNLDTGVLQTRPYEGPTDGRTSMFDPGVVGNGLKWPRADERIELEVEFLESCKWYGQVFGPVFISFDLEDVQAEGSA